MLRAEKTQPLTPKKQQEAAARLASKTAKHICYHDCC